MSNNLAGEYFYFSCYALILTFGIIHGANDILLLMKGKNADKKTVINKTLKYFSIVVLICLVFFNLPVISLLFFLLFSAYHFGEQQWTIFENNLLTALYSILLEKSHFQGLFKRKNGIFSHRQNFCHEQKLFCPGQFRFCPSQKIFCSCRRTRHKIFFRKVTMIATRLRQWHH